MSKSCGEKDKILNLRDIKNYHARAFLSLLKRIYACQTLPVLLLPELKRPGIRDKNRFEQWLQLRDNVKPVVFFNVIEDDVETWEVQVIEK